MFAMKVLIISAAFPPFPAGEAEHMFHLSKRLGERGAEVLVLTSQRNGAIKSSGFTVDCSMRDWSWSDLPRFISIIRTYSPNAILLKYTGWLYNRHPMITFAPTLAKLLLPDCSFVTQFGLGEGPRPEELSLKGRIVRKAMFYLARKKNVDWNFGTLLRDSNAVILLSEIQRSEMIERLGTVREKTLLIPPPPILFMSDTDDGVSRRRGRELLDAGSSNLLIAYFGFVYPDKGVETLLRAFHIVTAHRNDARLVVIGGRDKSQIDGTGSYSEMLDNLCKQLGIERYVIWRDYESNSQEGSLFLRAADICVLPFDFGVGLIRSSVAAAAAHDLPIITTRGKTLEAAFKDGDNVLLCPPKDPKSLAAAIDLVASNPELKRRLSQGASSLADEWFSWDKAIDKTWRALSKASCHPAPS